MTLSELLAKPVWSKEVVAYVGNAASIEASLRNLRSVQIDVLDLCPADDEWPNRLEDRAELLTKRLDERLRHENDGVQSRTVFWIRNAALLARYRVGIRPFYDWLGGGRSFTILHIDRIRELDDGVVQSPALTCDARRMVDFFRTQLQIQDRVIVEVA